ncbi:MAG: alpha/beta fold hydrolase [Opitutaceae bacterium]|nr:alpha/beta fold hydrolase [Opitutaceae bacterium]
MKPLFFRAFVAFQLLSCVSTLARDFDLSRLTPVPADQQIPAEDFFRQSLMREPQVNPAGTHISALVSVDEDKAGLLLYEIATQKIERVGGDGSKDIYWTSWLDDNHLIFRVSFRKLYGLGIMVGRVGRLTDSYPLLQYTDAQHLGTPEDNRMRPVFWLKQEPTDRGSYLDGGIVALRAELDSGHRLINLHSAAAQHSDFAEMLEGNRRHTETLYPSPRSGLPVGFMLDRECKPAFAFTSDKGGVVTLHRWAGEGWQPTTFDLDTYEVLTHGDNPGELIINGRRETGKPRTVEIINIASGESKGEVLTDKSYDFEGWFFRDPTSLMIVGAQYERDGPAVIWFEEGYATMQKSLDAMFKGLVVRIIGADKARKTLIVRTFSDRQPDVFYFVDLEKRSVGLLKNSRPWIDPKRMRPMNIMKFKTRDGKTLDAYLTLPDGASKTTPAPLVVLPHGGPFARDNWGHNPEVQFLASRGYAVLQPNYRGSTGYSWQFTLQEEWDFVRMHDDVTDATKTALKTGLVDAKRVAIMGASFGGYLALSGVTKEPDLYRCAVTNVGVFDWAQLIQDSKYNQYDSPRYAALMRHLGDPKKAAERFAAMSPIHAVSQIKVPVMVAHGKEDNNVSVSQSRRLISQLEKHNVRYEKMIVSGEGHGMGNLGNRVEFYERADAFLRKNLAPTVDGAVQ